MNLIIQAKSAGIIKSQTHFSHSLQVHLIENYGQLIVTEKGSGKALSRVYVKVYSEKQGDSSFHKDGYTDFRGLFDYATVSSGPLDGIARFAILIASEKVGATIIEALPPKY